MMNSVLAALLMMPWVLAVAASDAEEGTATATAMFGQFTHVSQWHPNFPARYSGPNSLSATHEIQSTDDWTLYAGLRPWQGAEVWVNPEIDMGFGLSNTVGVGGYPSGEAYKVGRMHPYFRLPRAFIRQVIDIDGEADDIPATANQLAQTQTANRLILTLGKFSVGDIFDTNRYAHDPRADFLNWTVVDAGAFDYAADAWGYTYGGAAEWTQDRWTLRGGMFALSRIPNSAQLDSHFDQRAVILELERRYQWADHAGKWKWLAFDNRGNMGSYADALRLASAGGGTPDTALVRHRASRPGAAFNMEQEFTQTLGTFMRVSVNRGDEEAFEFTEVNRSVAIGAALQGTDWHRPQDVVGIAVVMNGLSAEAQRYFAAGGKGILIGDGRLQYAPERVFETYYAWQATTSATLSFDLQYLDHPAYNRDRGPVPIVGVRLHLANQW